MTDEPEQLTLGEIISKCEEIQRRGYKLLDGSEPIVIYDFAGFFPQYIDSWRGAYSELALSIEQSGPELTISAFINLLKAARGKAFQGYKGGSYTMHNHTPVWAANHGESGNTAIIGVKDLGYQVLLTTAYKDY